MVRIFLLVGVVVVAAVASTVVVAGGKGGRAAAVPVSPGIVMGQPLVTAHGVVDGSSFIPVAGAGSTSFLRRVPLVAVKGAAGAPSAPVSAVRPLCRETVKGVLILRGRACQASPPLS